MVMDIFKLKINADQRWVKKTTPKLKIYKNIKFSLAPRCAKLSLIKKLINIPTHAFNNSCLIANINICKYITNLVDL
jgi:hypothetical protein